MISIKIVLFKAAVARYGYKGEIHIKEVLFSRTLCSFQPLDLNSVKQAV